MLRAMACTPRGPAGYFSRPHGMGRNQMCAPTQGIHPPRHALTHSGCAHHTLSRSGRACRSQGTHPITLKFIAASALFIRARGQFTHYPAHSSPPPLPLRERAGERGGTSAALRQNLSVNGRGDAHPRHLAPHQPHGPNPAPPVRAEPIEARARLNRSLIHSCQRFIHKRYSHFSS